LANKINEKIFKTQSSRGQARGKKNTWTGMGSNVDTGSKFRKQQGTGRMGKKLNIGTGSGRDGPRERTLRSDTVQSRGVAEKRRRTLGRGRPRTAVFPREGKRQWENTEIITGGEPEQERHRKET